ncbi:MAG: hypothetical protein AAFV47_02705 [Pseudomonadota bacterium]
MSFAWALFVVYLLATAWLGWIGHKRTGGFDSFALGGGDMHPLVVGITLAASTASAATFIVNPGFIYVDGLSAWFHLVPGLVTGLTGMLFLLSPAFRRIGAQTGALTLPDWIARRFDSRRFAIYFAILSLLSFAFVVLLVGGISIVMQQLLGLSNIASLIITLTFVTGYVFIGGTHAHVLTNMLQGTLMIIVCVLVLGSCVWVVLQSDVSLVSALRTADPDLLRWVNPNGQFFSEPFTVFVAGFIIGAILACQPHILTKALYVSSDRAVKQYLWVFAGVMLMFAMLVTVGFVAHLVVDPADLIDTASGAFRQDLVMMTYLGAVFPPWLFTVIAVVLLAAAMSTLDGLLVALSTITANDLVLNLGSRGRSPQAHQALAMRAGHVVLLVMAVAAFVINLSPPRLLGIFGQTGVYGLAAALAPPLVLGVFCQRPPLKLALAMSVTALVLHFGLYFSAGAWLPGIDLNWANPGVTASVAAIPTLVPAAVYAWMER